MEAPVAGVIEDADADALYLCGCDELGETGMPCGVALPAADFFLIVLLGELCDSRDGEKIVGKLSFVGFFVRPGWL